MAHQGYGFCEFLTEEDAEYACKIMNQIKLWGKPIRVNKVRTRLIPAHALLLRCSPVLCVLSPLLLHHIAPYLSYDLPRSVSPGVF